MRKAIVSIVAALALAGCAAGHLSASYSALCAYHAWRGIHDVRTHHSSWAAFQAWRAVHTCPRAVR
jgi:uncharacterized lipoprotein YmbA